ncbi:sporulation protein YtfJ [candidate division WWE3 bacterium]|nr:sporulation protein YtfJ [candidate division WWE3 bacterium]
MDVQKLFDSVIGELDKMVNTKRIIGDPVTFEGRTILPVIKVNVGYGGGGGAGEGNDDPKGTPGGSGSGGGAGAGANMEPVALIVIDREGVKVYPLKGSKGVAEIIEAIADKAPELMEKGIELKARNEKPAK